MAMPRKIETVALLALSRTDEQIYNIKKITRSGQ